MEITLSSQSHIQASLKQERHIIAKLEEKREPALQRLADPDSPARVLDGFVIKGVWTQGGTLPPQASVQSAELQPQCFFKEQMIWSCWCWSSS